MDPIGTYEGTDAHGHHHSIPRFVDPERDGTKLAADCPRVFDVSAPPDSIDQPDFDRMLEASVPADVLTRIDRVIVEATELARVGRADSPPLSVEEWRRGIILSWLHSRDLGVILIALGHPRHVQGVHDVEEFALGKRLKERLASADEWYRTYVLALPDDEPVNVGFFNPHLSASMYKWGDAKTGTQNAMDAHRLASHHVGTPEAPLEWMERAANFVVHHIPREHLGIRHEPRGQWSDLEPRLAEDPAIKDAEIGKVIARDAARLAELLELEGKINPWQLLRVPADAAPTISQVEHALLYVKALAAPSSSMALAVDESFTRAGLVARGADDPDFDARDLDAALAVLDRADRTIEAARASYPFAANTLQSLKAALPSRDR